MKEGADGGWLQYYGTALVTGIGFTMSLFIGSLAFGEGPYASGVKIGTIVGSVLSAVLGAVVLFMAQS